MIERPSSFFKHDKYPYKSRQSFHKPSAPGTVHGKTTLLRALGEVAIGFSNLGKPVTWHNARQHLVDTAGPS
jgi:hypothetical protein